MHKERSDLKNAYNVSSLPQPKGAFEQLLCKEHLVLYNDMIDRAELYEEETRDLVERMANGLEYSALSEQDKRRLDHATLAYALQPPGLPKKPAKKPNPVRKTAEASNSAVVDIVEADLNPFWWLGGRT